MRKAAILLLLLFTPTVLAGTTYYVRVAGNDARCDGLTPDPYDPLGGDEQSCAFASVSACYDAMSPGDVCDIGEGEFYDFPRRWTRDGEEMTLTGTLDCTHGSTEIVGHGTAFTSEVHPGDFVRCATNPPDDQISWRVQGYMPYTEVASVDSDTHLTLVEGYRGTTASGDSGSVARFFVFRGKGRTKTILSGYRPLSQAQYGNLHKVTGVTEDCNGAEPGTQDCENVWAFCAPHSEKDGRPRDYADDLNGKYSGLLQPFWDDIEWEPVTSYLVGLDKGVHPFTEWNTSWARTTKNDCDTEWRKRLFVNMWPGSLSVELNHADCSGYGDGTWDLWYFHPRGDVTPTADNIYIGFQSRSTVEGSYHIFEDLSVIVAGEYNGNKFYAGYGFGLIGAHHVIYRRIAYYGQALAMLSQPHHFTIENSIIANGFTGGVGLYVGFFRSWLGGFNHLGGEINDGVGGENSLDGATVWDSCKLQGGVARFYDDASEDYNGDGMIECWEYEDPDDPESDKVPPGDCCSDEISEGPYDFAKGTYTHPPSSRSSHGPFFMNNSTHIRPYGWVINCIIETGSGDIAMYPGEYPHWRFINNSTGRGGLFSEGHAHFQLNRTPTVVKDASDMVVRNMAMIRQAEGRTTEGGSTFWTWRDDGYTAWRTVDSDYNGYFLEPDGWKYVEKRGVKDDPLGTCEGCSSSDFRVALGSVQYYHRDTHSFWANGDLSQYWADVTFNDDWVTDWTPLAGNPVIDAGDNEWCPEYDYLGNPRDDGKCDIGAIEYQGDKPSTACNDGIDNDGDGAVDYPADFGCTSLWDDSETGSGECADGVDNNGDGKADQADVPCCSSFNDTTEDAGCEALSEPSPPGPTIIRGCGFKGVRIR